MTRIRVRRTNLATGHVLDHDVHSLRQAEALVAWCGTDNLHMTRGVASVAAIAAGQAFKQGRPYTLNDQYRFEVLTAETAESGVPE